MPSVRVKRGYSTLGGSPVLPSEERPATRPRSRSLAQIFGHPLGFSQDEPPQDDAPDAPHLRLRSHTLSEGGTALPPPLPRQPSRVRSHIMSTAMVAHSTSNAPRNRASSILSSVGRSLSSASHEPSDMVTIEGRQENILVPEEPGYELGRIGSALSMRTQDSTDPFQELHDDDVVEHLDVIDPQVATVSTLTNAANAIVIPPLSFYSRKPVVVLDVPPRSEKPEDTETGSTQPPEDNLDRHVEDVLARRARFRRVMRGIWSFMKTPMGIIVSIYGFLVVFWGAGIVLFLAKIINLHNPNTQAFWVEVCQQVETGLFSVTSIGLIPFRTLDTYRITKIWFYKRRTRKLRKKAGIPELYDVDDLPDPVYDPNYIHVLTEEEQADLHYQQHKFMHSQTWYRAHGTQTHRAFPISIALWICILNDLNSVFQCLLSGCMWGLNRFQRPAWTTATTLPAAFVSGILAGCYIYWGGKKTKRHEQVEERLRTALAMDDPATHASLAQTGETDRTQEPVPEIVTTSASASVLPGAQPETKDYAETPSSSQPGSLASVPIADCMTVPAVEVLEFREKI